MKTIILMFVMMLGSTAQGQTRSCEDLLRNNANYSKADRSQDIGGMVGTAAVELSGRYGGQVGQTAIWMGQQRAQQKIQNKEMDLRAYDVCMARQAEQSRVNAERELRSQELMARAQERANEEARQRAAEDHQDRRAELEAGVRVAEIAATHNGAVSANVTRTPNGVQLGANFSPNAQVDPSFAEFCRAMRNQADGCPGREHP